MIAQTDCNKRTATNGLQQHLWPFWPAAGKKTLFGVVFLVLDVCCKNNFITIFPSLFSVLKFLTSSGKKKPFWRRFPCSRCLVAKQFSHNFPIVFFSVLKFLTNAKIAQDEDVNQCIFHLRFARWMQFCNSSKVFDPHDYQVLPGNHVEWLNHNLLDNRKL